jgi:hypothetical protein
MPLLTHEMDLIEGFVAALRKHVRTQLRIAELINADCNSRAFADVEFKSVSKIHWAIEAKSNLSPDKHNAAHKIFGELLKETGRTNRKHCRHAMLIPQDAVQFLSKKFQCVDRSKFVGFGKLIPINTVFTFGTAGIEQTTWLQLYDAHEGSWNKG